MGYNNEVAIDATIGDISFSIPAASGVPVAREDNNASRVLKAYKFTFTAETALTNATLTFNTTEQWLPDIFSVILTNTTVAANAAGVDGAVQYLIPEGDVVKVDATAETAGQVASVTVTGADGQDVKVENNKFTMPGQNVTADITFAEAPATATPAPATETPAPATATPEATEAPTPDPSATPSVRYTYTKGATTNGSFDVQNVSHPELVTKTADTANKVKWTAKNDLAKFENIVDPEPITVGDITIDPLNNATGGASDFWKHNTDTV